MTCEHKYIYLRQEQRNTGYDRNPVWLVEDVFFCEKCLAYKKVAVEKKEPRNDSLTEMYVERLV